MKHKIRSRVLTVLLAFLLIVGLLPTTVFAAAPTELWVNGVNIMTDADHTVECGEGTAVYNPADHTLTLKDALITQEHQSSGIYANGDLNIILEGQNNVSAFWSCIQVQNGDISIGGNGSLTADQGAAYGIWAHYGNINISADVEKLYAVAATAALRAEGGSISIGDKPYNSNDKKITIIKGVIVNLPPELMVGGVDILSAPDYTVVCGNGKAIYDPGSNTLTLDHAQIDYTVQDSNYSTTGAIVYNGDLNIRLIGENFITSNCAGLTGNNTGTLTITGDKLTIDSLYSGIIREPAGGSVTIDGAELTINVANTRFVDTGIKVGGKLSIVNGAVVDARNIEDSPLIGNGGVVISDSTVYAQITSESNNGGAIASLGSGISIQNSTVDAKTNSNNSNPTIFASGDITISNGSNVAVHSDLANAVYTFGGNVIIRDSEVEITTLSEIYPALASENNIEISDSAVNVIGSDTWYAIWANNGASVIGSWLEVTAYDTCEVLSISDSVIFLNNEGQAYGSLILPGDVTVGKDMQLSVPNGSSVTVPEGVTLTNHGTIYLMGSIIKDGGDIVCDSHIGGTATCTSKAVCDICGNEYGDLLPHELTKTEAKAATCTKAGNEEYWTCDTCGKIFSDEIGVTEIQLADTVLEANGHSYEDGKCAVCGAVDSNFKAVITAGANGTWQKGSKDGLSFTSNAAFEDFLKVQVDGKDLDPSNYTVKEGSTIVTLKTEYLDTLSVGKHTLAVISYTGTATTEFIIKAAPSADDVQSPQTGDNSNPVLWVGLLASVAILLAAVMWYDRRQKFANRK